MDIITQLTKDLEPIRRLAEQLLSHAVETETQDDRLQISRRPSVGTEAFAVTLYLGVDDSTIDRYQKIHSVEIPPDYKKILHVLNGASIFGLNLYGIPPSMAQDPPLLDRTTIQPLDLATANTHWRHGFTDDLSLFQIGGSPLSLEENVGYFLTAGSGVVSLKKRNHKVNAWVSMQQFLDEELERARNQYSEFEEFMAKMRKITK
ncbi:MAG: hypothetical protein SX243_25045 [Acidobacteriota bacterium]|nr:hypothetical protein [Acidobacteriota bacterium]